MKTAIYIEDGITQLVLTPENEWEKSIVSKLTQRAEGATVDIKDGEFFHNRAGYVRYDQSGTNSLIFVIREKEKTT